MEMGPILPFDKKLGLFLVLNFFVLKWDLFDGRRVDCCCRTSHWRTYNYQRGNKKLRSKRSVLTRTSCTTYWAQNISLSLVCYAILFCHSLCYRKIFLSWLFCTAVALLPNFSVLIYYSTVGFCGYARYFSILLKRNVTLDFKKKL